MECLEVVFIVDNTLIPHLQKVIESIQNVCSIKYKIHILTKSPQDKETIHMYLDSIVGVENLDVQVLEEQHLAEMERVYYPESRQDIKSIIYSQFYISYYFKAAKKLLFMEPDQIVRQDLAPLWKMVFLNDIKLAAVKSMAGEKTIETLKKQYPNTEIKTFNAGVMIVDTEFWLENNFTERCFEECKIQKSFSGNHYNFYQEGAMNIALQKEFIELDKVYNFFGLGWEEDIPESKIEQAVILHWNGNKKPWLENGLYKKYYTT